MKSRGCPVHPRGAMWYFGGMTEAENRAASGGAKRRGGATGLGPHWVHAVGTVFFVHLGLAAWRWLGGRDLHVSISFPMPAADATPLGPLWAWEPIAVGPGGVVLRFVAAIVAVALVYRLTRLDGLPSSATRAAWFVALSPTVLFAVAHTPFALASVCVAGALYASRRRRWGLSGLASAVAAVVMPPAGLVALAVIYEGGVTRAGADRSFWLGCWLLPLAAYAGLTAWAVLALDAHVPSAILLVTLGSPGWSGPWTPALAGPIDAAAVAPLVAIALVALLAFGGARRVRTSLTASTVVFLTAGIAGGTTVSATVGATLAIAAPIAAAVALDRRPAWERPILVVLAFLTLALHG